MAHLLLHHRLELLSGPMSQCLHEPPAVASPQGVLHLGHLGLLPVAVDAVRSSQAWARFTS